MRFYVTKDDTSIKKAYKVDLANIGACWVYFRYGTYPYVLSETEVKRNLFHKKEDAEKRIKENKAKRNEKEKEKLKKLDEVTEYLSHFKGCIGRKYIYEDEWGENPRYNAFLKSICCIYRQLPYKYLDNTNPSYIKLLEEYAKTGMLYSNHILFHREQIFCVEYGCEGAVRIHLADGRKITPASRDLARLIRVIFGYNNGWHYPGLKFPNDIYDIIEPPQKY